jgi:hypothetical protein
VPGHHVEGRVRTRALKQLTTELGGACACIYVCVFFWGGMDGVYVCMGGGGDVRVYGGDGVGEGGGGGRDGVCACAGSSAHACTQPLNHPGSLPLTHPLTLSLT